MRLHLAAAYVFVLPAALLAQGPARSQPGQLIVTGCVEPAQRNGSVAGTPVGTSAVSPNTADDEANSQAPVDRYLLTGAVVQNTQEAANGAAHDGTSKPELKSFALQGHDAELAPHRGHRVEITGMLAPPREASAAAKPSAARSGVPRLRVDSVKMIAASCSGA